jgi:hypothetical protein
LEYQFTTLKQKMVLLLALLETRNLEDFHMRSEASEHNEAQEVLETQRVIGKVIVSVGKEERGWTHKISEMTKEILYGYGNPV